MIIKNKFLLLALATFSIIVSIQSSSAAILNFNFSADIQQRTGTPTVGSLVHGTLPFSSISGSFSYDTDAADIDVNPAQGFFNTGTLILDQFTLPVFANGGTLIGNELFGDDIFLLSAYNSFVNTINFSLYDNTETAFTSDSLPLFLSLVDFTSAAIIFSDETQNRANAAYTITSLSSISAVPLPAGFWLFGSAIIGILGFRRRKNVKACIAVNT